jgi:tetraacyldisaccharide 4'-kinase
VLEAPDFWWRERSLTSYALAPLGALYGAIAARRMRRPGRRAPIPVICVGGLTLGGAGKTPTALAVAALTAEMGRRPGFVTRGYGGSEPGPVLVDPARHSAAEVGDEPLLLARAHPTVAGRDRLAGVRLLARLGCDLAVMDDGFQSPSPTKDLSLLVVDAARGIGNALIFPAGPLRAPLGAQMRRADAVLMVGQAGAAGVVVRAAARCGVPLLAARTEPARTRGYKRKRYLAFAGIAHPGKLYQSLCAAGARVEATVGFPDHHPFSETDCQELLDRAAADRLTPITTEKDMARLAGREGACGRLAAQAETFPIRIVLEEPRRLLALIEEALAGRGRGA